MTDFEEKLALYKLEKYDKDAVQNAVDSANKLLLADSAKKPRPRFILTQISFVTKKMWLLQGALLLFACGAMLLFMREEWLIRRILPLASIAAPLVILINITDFVRAYNVGSIELELATKFSLQKAAAAKLIIFGCSDAVFLAALSAFAAASTKAGVLCVLLYCLVPFNFMCCGCLLLLRKVKADSFAFSSAMLACGLCAVVFALNLNIEMYKGAYAVFWLAAFFITSVEICRQMYLAFKSLQSVPYKW